MIPVKIRVIAVDEGRGVSKKTGKEYAIPKVYFSVVGSDDQREKILNLDKGVSLESFPVGREVSVKLVLVKGQWSSEARLAV